MRALARLRVNLQQCNENRRRRYVLPPMAVGTFGALNLVLDAVAGGLQATRNARKYILSSVAWLAPCALN